MSRLFLLSLMAGVAGAFVADGKGRNWLLWGVLCAFFPLLLLVVFILPPALSGGRTKKCPYCSEIIRHEARLCRYCGRELPIEMVKCRNCGRFVPEGDYCPECRKSLR